MSAELRGLQHERKKHQAHARIRVLLSGTSHHRFCRWPRSAVALLLRCASMRSGASSDRANGACQRNRGRWRFLKKTGALGLGSLKQSFPQDDAFWTACAELWGQGAGKLLHGTVRPSRVDRCNTFSNWRVSNSRAHSPVGCCAIQDFQNGQNRNAVGRYFAAAAGAAVKIVSSETSGNADRSADSYGRTLGVAHVLTP